MWGGGASARMGAEFHSRTGIAVTSDSRPMAGREMFFDLRNVSGNANGGPIAVRCPACRQHGTFEILAGVAAAIVTPQGGHAIFLGQRRCPNRTCLGHVFIAYDSRSQAVLVSYPPQRLDFDTTDIPAGIVNALEEAITCHANGCFTASAIMVRKALEELCRERGATGATLRDRIRSLSSKAVLPQELLAGLDDLRLLGNDAAHVDSQAFVQVGRDEVEVGVELAREVLKAVYQYSALLARFRALKNTP